ncbi:PQ loop repeat-domain-containing protein [Paraphysoderma sedebokerense]|nr:PQ loop repeat-domain-containing protein [Paraphysoderma sedebokerense]
MSKCVCDPPVIDDYAYSQFWGSYFGECIYTPSQNVAMIAGLISILLYGVAMVPQLWKNYQRKCVAGLSLGLLLVWTFGDIANTIGAILTTQFSTQQYTGVYFLFIDVGTLGQYMYYRIRYPTPQPPKEEEVSPLLREDAPNNCSQPSLLSTDDSNNTPKKVLSLAMFGVSIFAALPFQQSPNERIHMSETPGMVVQSAANLGVPEAAQLCNATLELSPSVIDIGSALAWVSGLFYFCSRIPQIVENHKFRSVDGISIYTFLITILANLFYGISVILRINELVGPKFVESTLPYLIGSVGTLVFDGIIIVQAWLYTKKPSIIDNSQQYRSEQTEYGSI